MSKIAFLFPGQGSQFVGMGQELIAGSPEAQAVYATADRVLGFSLSRIMLEGPEEELNRTDVAQPALLTAATAAWAGLSAKLSVPRERCLAAGHSLGEYSALVAAGSLAFESALKLVQNRGKLMLEASRVSGGGMAAVIGATPEEAEALCRQADANGGVQVANLNCPGQVVISGSKPALDSFMALAAEKKVRVMPLKVSGPFHSRHMQPAADRLAAELQAVTFQSPQFPVLANVSAQPVSEPSQIRQALMDQVSGAVRWEESMRHMLSLGVTTMVEVGPGKVLRGLMKKIAPEVKTLGVFSPAEIDAASAELSGAAV